MNIEREVDHICAEKHRRRQVSHLEDFASSVLEYAQQLSFADRQRLRNRLKKLIAQLRSVHQEVADALHRLKVKIKDLELKPA